MPPKSSGAMRTRDSWPKRLISPDARPSAKPRAKRSPSCRTPSERGSRPRPRREMKSPIRAARWLETTVIVRQDLKAQEHMPDRREDMSSSSAAWRIVIAGGGIAGLSLGLALAQALGAGVAITVCDPALNRDPSGDRRAYAIAAGARNMLQAFWGWGGT